ncbi:MAG: LPS assembly lipoprotein LptE [Pseudomonadota bacterium]|nr:LPS assembly lipoprotein LptE [Pseudomonadota bacterium]
MKKTFFTLSLCLATTACSYAPMYEASTIDSGKQVSVGTVQISGVEMNVGSRRMPQRLSQKLNAAFPEGNGLYTLNVTLDEATKALATNRTAADERYQLQVVAHVKMLGVDGKEVLKTRLSQLVAYNVQTTGFATDSEEEAAHDRAVDRLAEDIIQQVYYKMYAMDR